MGCPRQNAWDKKRGFEKREIFVVFCRDGSRAKKSDQVFSWQSSQREVQRYVFNWWLGSHSDPDRAHTVQKCFSFVVAQQRKITTGSEKTYLGDKWNVPATHLFKPQNFLVVICRPSAIDLFFPSSILCVGVDITTFHLHDWSEASRYPREIPKFENGWFDASGDARALKFCKVLL